MGEYMQFSAKTKNEAITKACIELSSFLQALMIAGLLPIPKNPELPSLIT